MRILWALGVLGHVGVDVGDVGDVGEHMVGVEARGKLAGTHQRLWMTSMTRTAGRVVGTRRLGRGFFTLPLARGMWKRAGRTVQSLWMHLRLLVCRAGGLGLGRVWGMGSPC